jgi:predicted GH43/DUF377 family glycosyl hydrolase
MAVPGALLALAFVLLASGCNPSIRFALPAPAGPASTQKVEYVWKEHPTPVMARGGHGWDAVDALNPSVLRWRGNYWNFYSGFDGKSWHTGVATSPDGLAWTKLGKVLSPDASTWEGSYIAANGSAIVEGDSILYWYQAGRAKPAIGLARSRDGAVWSKEPAAVLEPGPRGSFDELGAADPYVIRAGDSLYLYYTGLDRAQRQRLGVARSRDGVKWVKSLDNPILDIGATDAWDEGGLGEPAVWSANGSYWMLYTGRAWDERRRLGLARSKDGVIWEKLPQAPFSGASPWNAAVLCDPTVEAMQGGGLRVWFGGGDIARPDERLNGQIGYATLELR